MKYLLATLAVLLMVGLVWLHVHHEHAVVAPPVVAEPAPAEPSGFSGPPVVPVEPEPVTPAAPVPPVKHKPAHKHMHRHYKVIYHGYYFHGQFCSQKWLKLPGSVTCMPSGQQFLPNELEWSIPK